MRHSNRKRTHAGAIAAVVALLLLGVTACGDDDDEREYAPAAGTRTEQAFLEAMVPHHKSAIEMAEVAERRTERAEIRKLARAIISAQDREIAQMGRIHRRLFGSNLKPDAAAHERLGLSAEEAAAKSVDVRELRSADSFDREFIDMMVPHHQGAIRMARVVLPEGGDGEVRELVEAIISAQSREIAEMKRWRKRWYGAASPRRATRRDRREQEEEGASGGGHG